MIGIQIDELNIPSSEILGIIRKNGLIPTILKDIIIDHELTSIELTEEFESDLLLGFEKSVN